MRDKIKLKFLGIKQKWVYLPLKSKVFSEVLDDITSAIRNGVTSADDAIDLIKSFKRNKRGWLKLVSVKGRKNLFCLCEVITRKNVKIKTKVSCEFILSSEIINGTPKSLKLFKSSHKSSKGKWKKPDDGFVDSSKSDIPLEEEFTELGYQLYKEWHEEIKASGLAYEEYKRKMFPHGYTLVKVSENW